VKLADVACQCGCGRIVVQPRGGGPRKKFYEGACRARWSRRGKQRTSEPKRATSSAAGHDDRQRTLQRIYDGLEVDVEERGVMVGGRANPAVEMLRKIGIELDRRAPVEEEQTDVVATLHAI
jgi:hypothetical protein